jgi:hypothetical protein
MCFQNGLRRAKRVRWRRTARAVQWEVARRGEQGAVGRPSYFW